MHLYIEIYIKYVRAEDYGQHRGGLGLMVEKVGKAGLEVGRRQAQGSLGGSIIINHLAKQHVSSSLTFAS